MVMNNKDITSRRNFLKKAAGGAAVVLGFPYFVKSAALGKNGDVLANNRIRMGFIGTGSQGTGDMMNFLGKSEVQMLAVCDVDSKHRQAAVNAVNSKYGNEDCKGYNDFRELLAREDIDAVGLALPDHWHALIAIAAAKAGKDIYGEKPLAYTISEGRAICDAVKQYGVVWQTGSWQRSVQQFRFACELVRNGLIGKVKDVHVVLPSGGGSNKSTKPSPIPEGFDYDMWLGPAPWKPYCEGRCHWDFRWIYDYSGGMLTDWAGHHVDIAHWGMNTELSSPVEIYDAKGHWLSGALYDTPDRFHFVCKYAEGFTLTVDDSFNMPLGITFKGSQGWIYVDRDAFDAQPKSLLSYKLGPNDIHLYQSNDHFQNFLDCIRTRRQTITPVEAAHHSIMVGHLGSIALKTGRELKWDNKTERFIGDEDANRYLVRPMRGTWHL
jgi:predicted dehydrogenase